MPFFHSLPLPPSLPPSLRTSKRQKCMYIAYNYIIHIIIIDIYIFFFSQLQFSAPLHYTLTRLAGMSCMMLLYTRAVYYYYYYDHFLPLSVCAGDTAAPPPRPPPGMSCMMLLYTRAVYYYYYYDHFLPLSVCAGDTAAPPPRPPPGGMSCTNISNTHFTVIGIFYYNNIMHTLSPSALPPLSLAPPLKTRGEGGGRLGETGAVGGGGGGGSGSSGSSSSSSSSSYSYSYSSCSCSYSYSSSSQPLGPSSSSSSSSSSRISVLPS